MAAKLATEPEHMSSVLEEVNKIKWFHTIDLGNGIVTRGEDYLSPKRLKRLRFPESLRGKTFLDIGAWDGFFSFEAERRGASKVLATDEFIWAGKGWASKAGFELARRVLGSKVEDCLISVYDISPSRVGLFDVVLFSGVLYHLEDPYLGIRNVASVTKELLILETHTDLEWIRRPAMAFYPGAEVRGDETNWSGPNTAAVKAMLSCCGFTDIKVVYSYSLLQRAARAAKWLWQYKANPLVTLQQRRIVVHARKPAQQVAISG
jgi:tRNA (mo5U34)-methyltransferase